MKQKEAELLIIQSQLEIAKDRVEALEDEERRLLLALGRDPDKSGIRLTVKSKKELDAAFAFLHSPEFAKTMEATGNAIQKAFLSIQRRQFNESKGWKPLFGKRAAVKRVHGPVKAGSTFK